ncbi:MAG: transposase [Candidatus Thiodiazotropha sp. (ex Lucinoma aequizonata)]|nr:transposase [Candidatus Thiodiazotropha sp. (ex Lucinoma aequizonata)]MCU7908639.1 transposase [Candidatus Thiodiazotropha sp. (ex Lucinoma aequizonata)]
MGRAVAVQFEVDSELSSEKRSFSCIDNTRYLNWAGEFLDQCCTKTMRSKIEAMKRVAKMLKRHRPLLLNWFRVKKKFSSEIIEGFNTKAKVTIR